MVSSKMKELDIIIDGILVCTLLKTANSARSNVWKIFFLIRSGFLWLFSAANMSGQQRIICCLLGACLKKLF